MKLRLSDMEFDGFNYESPIHAVTKRMYEDINMQFDNGVLRAIADVGISVDKDELIRALRYDRGQYEKGYADGIAAAEKARPVVCGEWVPMELYRDILVCSECDEICHDLESNFCPNCGADMREREDENG